MPYNSVCLVGLPPWPKPRGSKMLNVELHSRLLAALPVTDGGFTRADVLAVVKAELPYECDIVVSAVTDLVFLLRAPVPVASA